MAVKNRKNKSTEDVSNVNSPEEVNYAIHHLYTEPPLKINTSNILELKHTCDDAVKEYFSNPTAFKQSHVHEDIRLVLGWSAAIIGFASAYYGYTTPFQESKPIVGAGVVAYALLSAALTLYGMFVEKEIIFEGKRRTIAGRVSTERLTISSTASSGLPIKSYFSSAYLYSLFYPTPTSELPTSPYPNYTLTLNYLHSSSNNKALIHKGTLKSDKCFGEFFDKEGRFWKDGFEMELASLLSKVVGE